MPFWRMVSGGVKEEGMKGGGKCDGNADKVRGRVLLVRRVFGCVLSVGRPWGRGGDSATTAFI